jgi:hypothetical protein
MYLFILQEGEESVMKRRLMVLVMVAVLFVGIFSVSAYAAELQISKKLVDSSSNLNIGLLLMNDSQGNDFSFNSDTSYTFDTTYSASRPNKNYFCGDSGGVFNMSLLSTINWKHGTKTYSSSFRLDIL